ncbi:hypothetical protein KIN20_006800 [Parelaphostrongylus tenuis]|uniref:Uncharacterized protein n=1 Tax=Parelaphostrongylus tenuis TaxID=148309 RepID=A0AAD5M5F6_PARTN|nr:hypothetical protein KIN20_006800 [Parelaphostrongylus tenuis]
MMWIRVAASTRMFTVKDFSTLPVSMVYAEKPEVSMRAPGIAANEVAAKAFVEHPMMRTIFDILERQGSSALLPDTVISAILGQLTVTIMYVPMQCQEVLNGPEDKTIELERHVATELHHCGQRGNGELHSSRCSYGMYGRHGSGLFLPATRHSQEHYRPPTSLWRIGRKRCGKVL